MKKPGDYANMIFNSDFQMSQRGFARMMPEDETTFKLLRLLYYIDVLNTQEWSVLHAYYYQHSAPTKNVKAAKKALYILRGQRGLV